MTTLLLVRHATTAATGSRLGGWTPGVHLDDGGVEQAQRLSALLADVPLAAIYSSPLERTRDTARIVAAPHDLRVRTRKSLGEVDYGEWTDQPLATLRRRKLWSTIQFTPSRVTFPDGESMRGMQARIVGALEELAAQHGEDAIAVVSHADVIKAALAWFLGMPLDTFQRIFVMPASVSVVTLRPDTPPVVLTVNHSAGPLDLPQPKRRRSSGG